MKNCCVLIISYKEELECDESKSLTQALNVFAKRDIKIILPDNISTKFYDKLKNTFNFEYIKVNPSWMDGIKSYNKMCCSKEFYEQFLEYEYILIYQTDCWVYEDRLDEFIELGYDYYGAPWPIYNNAVGNGGFSLRKVKKMIEVCGKYSYNGRYNEDGWFCLTHKNDLNICDLDNACNFAMELFSLEYLKRMKTYPMGLHATMNKELWGSPDKFIEFKNNKLGFEKMLSVITVNLNNKEGLEKTIKSVTSQTCFEKIEYIVIDGGSTDGSLDVIKENEKNIDYYVSEKDNGVYNAMNKGIDVCKGEYVLFLNSGDYFMDNNSVEEVLPELKYGIVYGDLMVNNRVKKYPSVLPKNYFTYESLPHPSMFIKTSLMKKLKYKEEYNIISDWIFSQEAIFGLGKTYKHVDTVVSHFSLGGLSSNVKEVKKEKEKYYKSIKNDYEICVITPCYNQGKYIKETLDSLKASTYSDFHCVIVNDGSTDNSEEAILSCISGDTRFEYFKNENHGVSYTRNFAIGKTNSKYILCLDSDDKISPTYIENAVKYLNENDNVSIYYGKAKMFYDDGTEKDWNLPAFKYEELLKSNMIYCSHIYRRRDYNRCGGYDENMDGYEDWEFLVRLLYRNDNVYRTDDVVFYYRRHPDSMDAKHKDNFKQFRSLIARKNKDIYLKYLPIKQKENPLSIFICTDRMFVPPVKNNVYRILDSRTVRCDSLSTDKSFYGDFLNYIYVREKMDLSEYVGFCKYNRYFVFMDDTPNLKDTFETCGCIAAKNITFKISNSEQYSKFHNIEDLKIVGDIIKDKYSEYYDTYNGFMASSTFFPYSMFIMKKGDFKRCVDFVKGVLDEYVDVVGTDIEKRIIDNKEKYLKGETPTCQVGYQCKIGEFLAERLVNIFIFRNFKRIKIYAITEK